VAIQSRVAHAALGHVAEAEKEQKELAAVLGKVKPEERYLLNKAKDIFAVAETVLAGRIAAAKGDTDRAVELLRKAATLEDNLQYDEPANWPLPVRESLG
jgi:Flp pilus assembly protein TadD